MIDPIRWHRWLACELLRGHSYRQRLVVSDLFADEGLYVSVCRRCNNVQGEPVWVRSYREV